MSTVGPLYKGLVGDSINLAVFPFISIERLSSFKAIGKIFFDTLSNVLEERFIHILEGLLSKVPL